MQTHLLNVSSDHSDSTLIDAILLFVVKVVENERALYDLVRPRKTDALFVVGSPGLAHES